MKVTFVLNNDNWATISSKVAAIKDFFSPLDTPMEYDVIHTSYADIPFVPVSAIGGVTNTIGSTTTVDPLWFTKNISVLYKASDIIVFCLSPQDVQGSRTSIGIEQGSHEGVVQCCIFGINENDRAYINMVDQGNCFVLFVCHEIAHALYLLQGKKDNTHTYFYTGQATKVIPELMLGKTATIKALLNYCLQLLGLYKQQQITMNTSTDRIINYISAHPKIYSWAKAIEIAEGSKPELNNPGNLKVSSLTQSWGATSGFNATDGGSIARFRTRDEGMQALCNFLKLGCENQLIAFHKARTLGEFTKIYAGNPPQGYVNTIVSILRVSIDTDIATFL